jgi:NDP-sugar pyrophosphorylase family protein
VKALVLCAGLGTRLGALTAELPKPMLSVGGEPLLAHTLRHLASEGFTDVALNLHFFPSKIREYFKDGSAFNLRIQYSYERELLGTAGAVKKLEPFFADVDDFLVVYGDVLTNQSFRALAAYHAERRALMTLTVHQRVGSNSAVALNAEGRIVEFLERPGAGIPVGQDLRWVNSGIQMLNRRVLSFIDASRPSDLPRDVVIPLLREEAIFGFPLTGARIAIDSEERYRLAEKAVAEGLFSRTP